MLKKAILIFAGVYLGLFSSNAAVSHVIHFTVDGLSGYCIKGFLETNAAAFPNFKRLQRESACTYNARCDYDYSETIQNHITIFTARPVNQPSGVSTNVNHGYGASASGTIHSASPAFYKASFMDVAHDRGLKVAVFLGKTKISMCIDSYNAQNGAADAIGEDNGKQKYDHALIASTTPSLLTYMTNILATNPPNYVFFHFVETDTVGHSSGWFSTQWSNTLVTIDGWLGQIFDTIDKSALLSNNTAIVLTADHGGGGDPGTKAEHFQPDKLYNYTVPIFVKGPGFLPGTDLYQYFSNRFDPGTNRVVQDAGVSQPLRNGDTANIALMLLGLPPIPGSYWQPQYLSPYQPIAVELVKSQNKLTLRWQLQSGFIPEFTDNLSGGWTPISTDIQSNETHCFIEIQPTQQIPSRFYRLKKN
ncbi:MAG: alkaline phosphatase [Verrucomicrobiae bacterium]|nr:alkaline phosphatase [Verrucomicrobiae bacterium]